MAPGLTVQPARRREFEPSSKRRKRRPAPWPPACRPACSSSPTGRAELGVARVQGHQPLGNGVALLVCF